LQFIDLKTQYQLIETEILNNIKTVLDHGQYIMGPEVYKLEVKLADYVGVKHCISCSSGTDALLMSLMALDIGPGDAVFTTPFTFIATAEVIQLLGATPVFVDIDKDTFNISPEKLEKEIESVIQNGELIPKAIIPVDLFGLPANSIDIQKIAKSNGLRLIIDSAQGFGSSINGKITCGFGDVGTTSFFPAKPLGCYGDGGAIFTNDEDLYKKLISIRIHGKGSDKYDNIRIGINGRLDTIQATILITKLKYYKEEIELRNQIAQKYTSKLNSHIKIQHIPDGYKSVWAQYSILANDSDHRTKIQTKLKQSNIPSAVYYPIPLHLQTSFKNLEYKQGEFEISEITSTRILSLPMHPYLKAEDIQKITSIINET